MSDKIFSFSKEGMERLKTITNVSNYSFIERDLFMRDEGSTMFFKTRLKDVPDDFKMGVYDLSSFISTYKMMQDPVIDYSDLEEKGFVKIQNGDGVKGKEYFIFRNKEASLMTNSLDITKSGGLKASIMKEDYNTLSLSKESVGKILKACKVIDAGCIHIRPVDSETMQIILFNPKIVNCNKYEIEIQDGVKINAPNVFFNMSVDVFAMLEKEVEEYHLSYSHFSNRKGDADEGSLICIENDESGLEYYTSGMTKIKKNILY